MSSPTAPRSVAADHSAADAIGLGPDYQLPIAGFQGTPEEIERQWFLQCYRGRGDRMKQLTLRALVMGAGLGAILSVTNIYIGLKAGWAFGVAITACILSYAIWTTLYRLRLARTPMTILENNCMQTAASAAGYSTGGTLISAFAAYMMLYQTSLDIWQLLAWVFLLAILGVTMAVPMKRQMINTEQLKFPSGVAAAETLKALYSTGSSGMRSAKALGVTGLIAALLKLWADGLALISEKLAPFQISTWFNQLHELPLIKPWATRTVSLSTEFMFIAAGAITGLRVCASMMLGAVLCWMVFVPILQGQGLIATDVPVAKGFRTCIDWTLWGGTACMVTSGILAFALQWRSALRAFGGLAAMLRGGRDEPRDPIQAEMNAIETPGSWFVAGQLFALVGLCVLGAYTLSIPVWQTILGVVLSFALALVACRVTGETDTTPIGAMGKITQLTFGAIAPPVVAGSVEQAMRVNLMSANITAGAAGSSAALLTDLKSGYLLGAHPRKQFLAQFSGVFLGTIITVIVFKLLVPTHESLGTGQFPAPAAMTWKAVAVAMGEGIDKLHPVKKWSLAIGGLVGLVLPLLALAFPKKAKYMPSAAGLGLAWTFPWYNAFYFFIGGLIAWWLEKRHPKLHQDYTFTVASGWIAGESLMGAGLIVTENGPAIVKQLFGGAAATSAPSTAAAAASVPASLPSTPP